MGSDAVAMAMAELWHWPAVGLLVKLLGHIPINRGDAASGKRALAASKRLAQTQKATQAFAVDDETTMLFVRCELQLPASLQVSACRLFA